MTQAKHAAPAQAIAPGAPFDRWTVVRLLPGGDRAQCRCACGTERPVRVANLQRGASRSCGCLTRDATRAHRRTHGSSRTDEYRLWRSMVARCHTPSATSYARYGGRGIVVCDAWRASFVAFRAAVGARPSKAHTLERRDNARGYAGLRHRGLHAGRSDRAAARGLQAAQAMTRADPDRSD